MSTTSASHALAERLSYHANLAGVISPMLEYNPRAEITAEQALQLNHYRVSRDAEDRLIRIAYYVDNKPSDGAYFSTHEVRYSYQADGWTRTYYDASGAPTTMWRHYYASRNVHKEVYTRTGDMVSLSMFGLEGEPVTVGTGSHRFTANHAHPEGFVQRQYRDDGSPNVIFDYLPFETALVTKDKNGFLDRIIRLNDETLLPEAHENAGFAEMRLDFDEWGNELGWHFRDVNGNLVNRAETTIDPGYAKWSYNMTWHNLELGLFTGFTERLYRADNSLFCIENVRCGVRISRDNQWRLKSIEYLGKNGQLVMDPTEGIARREFQYPEGAERTSTTYDADDNLIAEGS